MMNPPMLDEPLPHQFWLGVDAFNQQRYYDCHDILEDLWSQAMEPQRKFYQGVLQLAVALHHLSNSNWQGAVTLLGEGLQRLQGFQPEYEEVNVLLLFVQCSALLNALQTTGPEMVTHCWQRLTQTNNLTNSLIGQEITDSLQLPTIQKMTQYINVSPFQN